MNNLWDFFDDIENERKRKMAKPAQTRINLTPLPLQQPQSQPKDFTYLFSQEEDKKESISRPRLMPPIANDLPQNGGMTGQMRDFSTLFNNNDEITSTTQPQRNIVLQPMQNVPGDPVEAATRPRLVPNMPIENAPLSIDERIRNSQKAIGELSDANNPQYQNNDKGFWGRVWDIVREGIIGGGAAWNQNANLPADQRLMTAIGGIGAGGLNGGFNPSADEQRLRLYDLNREQQNLNGLYNQAEFESKQTATDNKNQLDKLSVQKQALENLRAVNKPLYDSVTADDIITEAEARQLNEAGYPVVPYDARKYQTKQVEGESFESPTLGKPSWQKSDLPTERVKSPVGVTVANPDGESLEVPMLPKDAAELRYRSQRDKAQAEAKQAEIERRQQELQEKREEKTFQSVQEWQIARSKAKEQIPVLERSVGQINNSIAEIDNQIKLYQGSYDTSELVRTKQNLEKQKADAELKLADAKSVYNSPRPQTFKPSSGGRNPRRNRTYSDSDIDRIIRQ